ncbi:GAF and ANTAR domain-containing protein [Modestobacter italicus]|uniref:GAF and ANTAR domain-containing protein n=1 Tax=Modestobacter italicus (strain DSM 44449 / CECT 9708 / BC 501) TaxID=2732864 RepID=UPI001C979D4B|nr:GAF and ANTAR domain-containing protein [Modestobacter italicus]
MTPPGAADILAGLAGAGPVTTWPGHLVDRCRTATLVSGVGLAVMSTATVGSVLAATDGHAQEMEDLQFLLGEGPCTEAITSGRPVLVPDLSRQADRRWPAFTAGATERGVLASFAFPLQVGAVGIGVLDLYDGSRGPLSDRQYAAALSFADAATAVLLHLQYDRVESEDGARTRSPDRLHQSDRVEVVDRRAVVHQAAGMISVQLGVDLATALLRLRGHAFGADRSVLEVAGDVVVRRLRFDDSAAGTVQTSPGTAPGAPDPAEESS